MFTNTLSILFNRLKMARKTAQDIRRQHARPQIGALPLMSRSPTYERIDELPALRRGVAERVPVDTAATDSTYYIGDEDGDTESAPTRRPSSVEDSMRSYYAA